MVSGLAVSFLLWLLYVHHASADFAGRWMFLPVLNALLNGLCAITLCVGLYFIKHHNIAAHRTSMLVAFAFSSAFLVSYIVNHTLHGDTVFPGHGTVRTVYLSILASHVILSVVALPMVLTTFFFLTDRPVRDPPPNRALDVSYLALRFGYWRGGVRLSQGVCLPSSILIRPSPGRGRFQSDTPFYVRPTEPTILANVSTRRPPSGIKRPNLRLSPMNGATPGEGARLE